MKISTRKGRAAITAVFLALVGVAAGCGDESGEEHAGHGEHGDWCAGHGLPESKCTKCNPELTEKFKEAGDWCEEHGFPMSACPVHNPMEPPGDDVPPPVEEESVIEPGTRIRFNSPELEGATGIKVVEIEETALGVGVEATARIAFDANRVADIRAAIPGTVRDVRVDLGDDVEHGDPLFVLESPQVGDLQGKIRAARERVQSARSNLERQQELAAAEISSARDLELARQEHEAAEAELASLTSSLRIAGASDSAAGGRYTERAPIAGTVIRRPSTVGTFASAETSLATIADTSVMWALLDVRETDAAAVRRGQKVELLVDGAANEAVTGEITWVSAEVDPRTRTVAARAEVENPDGVLRANQFARASIEIAAPSGALAVPRGAVQRIGEEHVIFVRTGGGLYEPRVVELGRTSDTAVQVEGEIEPGDHVVTEGSFLLKTELLRGSIGAGCCEVEGPGGEE